MAPAGCWRRVRPDRLESRSPSVRTSSTLPQRSLPLGQPRSTRQGPADFDRTRSPPRGSLEQTPRSLLSSYHSWFVLLCARTIEGLPRFSVRCPPLPVRILL